MTDLGKLKNAIMTGKRDEATGIITAALAAGDDPTALLEGGMISAMREIGEKFNRNEVYVPQMLIAARAMQAGLLLLEPVLAKAGHKSRGKICIGTVKGDLHDIGKNLVAIMLKGAGYDVVDLGVNCDVDKYETGVGQGATIVACSALLTTTMFNRLKENTDENYPDRK